MSVFLQDGASIHNNSSPAFSDFFTTILYRQPAHTRNRPAELAAVALVYVVCNRFRVYEFTLFGLLSCLFYHCFPNSPGFVQAFEEVEDVIVFYVGFQGFCADPLLAEAS